MKQFNDIGFVYFLGIGGIGMSALARYFRLEGKQVAGYDRTPSELTRVLESEGIKIHYHDDPMTAETLTGEKENTLVVITPAIPHDLKEWGWLHQKGFHILKRARVLGMICNQYRCLAVAGTHGKTTVSTLITNILRNATQGCGAFLGGISRNFNTNFLPPVSTDQWVITEADEYDRSFLNLTPDLAVVTSMDADHLDIYGEHCELKGSFRKFTAQVRDNGTILAKKGIANDIASLNGAKVYTYALEEDADFYALELNLDKSTLKYSFRLRTPSGTTNTIIMNYPGKVNVENAVAAGAAAWLTGAGEEEIRRGIEEYKGVARRFDIRYRDEKTVYIDDYAHHPEELRAFITSVRLLFPGKRVTGIFQPHLYSRTRDFATGFAESLDLLDSVALLPIYPARELPIPGVSSEMIFKLMKNDKKTLMEKSEIRDFIRIDRPEILLTIGAGDIDLHCNEIIEILKGT